MSFNGSGTFVINSSGQPVVANTVISSTVFNALTADLATGLSTCITKDGQTTPTANIPMGTFKFTNLGAGSAATDSATLGQVQASTTKLVTVSGTDTITGTMTPALTAYASGQMFYFVAGGANTGAVTLNIDGLGARNVTRHGSVALVAGDILSGEVCVVVYDGTRFQLLNPASYTNLNVSGVLTLALGAVGAPSLSFTGDSNTGLWSPAADTLAASTGGSERLRVDSSGNVGIGTIPSAWRSGARALQLGVNGYVSLFEQGNGAANLTFAAYESAANTFAYRTTGDAPTIYSQVGGVHTWSNAVAGTAGNTFSFTERMRLDASGNLGIGTASPTAYGGYTTLAVNNATNGGLIDLLTNGTRVLTMYAGSTSVIGTANASNLAFITNNTERARFDTSGNLGIGTASPVYRLDVAVGAGSASIARFGQTGVSNGYTITSNGTDLTHDWSTSGSIVMTLAANRNLGLGTNTFGASAVNVIAIANGTAPTSSPSGQGQLYVEGGALKYRGSSGTITTIANA